VCPRAFELAGEHLAVVGTDLFHQLRVHLRIHVVATDRHVPEAVAVPLRGDQFRQPDQRGRREIQVVPLPAVSERLRFRPHLDAGLGIVVVLLLVLVVPDLDASLADELGEGWLLGKRVSGNLEHVDCGRVTVRAREHDAPALAAFRPLAVEPASEYLAEVTPGLDGVGGVSVAGCLVALLVA